MKKSLAILAVAGMATAASAQWTFELAGGVGTAADPLDSSQDTARVVLSAGFPTADFAFAGARLSVHASEAGWSSLLLRDVQVPPSSPGPTYPDPFGRHSGIIAGGDVNGIIAGQLNIGPFVADPANPIPLWEADFTVTDFTTREIDLSTRTEEFRVYIDAGSPASEPRTIGEGSGTIFVVPAPASLALLGLGGLAVARRRR